MSHLLSSSFVETDSYLNRHTDEMRALFNEVMQGEFSSDEELNKKLPLLRHLSCEATPGTLRLYLLCSSSSASETSLLLQELIHLFLKDRIFSVRHHLFSHLYFEEILLRIENNEELSSFLKNLSSWMDEIKVGMLSKKLLTYLIGMKRLPYDEQVKVIFEKVIKAIHRHPKAFREDLIRETEHFLIHFTRDLRRLHETNFIFRLICSHYLFRKTLEQEVLRYSGKRHLSFKLTKTSLTYPFGKRNVFGILIALNSLHEYECFESRHILRALQRINAQIRLIPESFCANRDHENRLHSLYLEIEKVNGEDFSVEEILELKTYLKEELKNSIEHLSPSLFFPRNDEEVFRNILQLAKELKYVDDLPQAVLSFQEQKGNLLRFNIILLRVLTAHTPPIHTTAQSLSSHDHLFIEKVTSVGKLRKKYNKEAALFSLEVPSHLFLRKNHSVDLLLARSYIVKTLEKMVGPFRDFNGGFLLKKNEQLLSLKRSLGRRGKSHEQLLENLFYSLTPAVMQTTLTKEQTKGLFSLFLDLIDQEMTKSEVLIEKEEKRSYSLVIKTEKAQIKERLVHLEEELSFDALKLASATVEVEGCDYFCFLLLNPTCEEKTTFVQL